MVFVSQPRPHSLAQPHSHARRPPAGHGTRHSIFGTEPTGRTHINTTTVTAHDAVLTFLLRVSPRRANFASSFGDRRWSSFFFRVSSPHPVSSSYCMLLLSTFEPPVGALFAGLLFLGSSSSLSPSLPGFSHLVGSFLLPCCCPCLSWILLRLRFRPHGVANTRIGHSRQSQGWPSSGCVSFSLLGPCFGPLCPDVGLLFPRLSTSID